MLTANLKNLSRIDDEQFRTNNEELDYLELLLHNHEYEEKDKKLIDRLEFKFYQLKEKESLRIKNILKAQSKQPKAEW